MRSTGHVQGIQAEQPRIVIHLFPKDIRFEDPQAFTDPFRYIPHPSVQAAAGLLMEKIGSDPKLSADFSEGKMLGVLVCRQSTDRSSLCYLAAFSGNVGGRSTINGFVPPIYDLLDPDGHFKIKEAEITQINRQIASLESAPEFNSLKETIQKTEEEMSLAIDTQKSRMASLKQERDQIRKDSATKEEQERLIKESQHEKAELRRMKQAWEHKLNDLKKELDKQKEDINTLKKLRAAMSDDLQDWIFRQYIVHNADGEESSIADIFAEGGMTPPGGTGECAAPKLLEYAYRNGLEPLAMGEFWYGRSSETAVRTHGHFYPSCTSKCGPLLGHMLKGLDIHTETSDSHTDLLPVIIHEDEVIIVVEKPSGMPSVPGLDGKTSLQEWLMAHYTTESIHAVHRLDMDTSGIMIFAKTPSAAASLRKQFELHTIRKTYTARIYLPTPLERQRIDLPLAPDYDERPRQKVDFKQGKEAHTDCEIVHVNPDGTADLLLHPVTGRTHQLRVHCAHALGLCSPIIGDLLYGSYTVEYTPTRQKRRLHLHALSITFRHPFTGAETSFSSDQLSY